MVADALEIVIVEDDDGHARLIEKNLRRSGIQNELVRFSDGKSALTYVQEHTEKRYLLILLDLNLPVIDGYEVLRTMKDNEDTRKIPIIVLTTTDNPQEVKRCYELGCNVYVTKPIDYQSFAEAMRKLGLFLTVVQIPDSYELYQSEA